MDTNTHPSLGRLVLVAGGAALALALAGCDRADNKTAGQQLDTAIAKTEQAARDAKATTESLAADAKAKAAKTAMLFSRINVLLSIPMLATMAMNQTLFG